MRLEKITEKTTLKSARRLFFFFAALLIMAGCGPDPFYVQVMSIEGVPKTGEVGTPLTLTGTIRPFFASNKNIIWSVKDAGTTGAGISGNILNTVARGTVTIRATITDGIAEGRDYTQDFKIVFSEGAAVITPITAAAINVWPPAKNDIPSPDADSGEDIVNYTIGDVSWSPDDNPFKGETVYTAAVTLTANEGYKFPNTFTAKINGESASISENTGTTVKISYTFAPTLGKVIVSMSIKSPPAKMTYTAGEALDLSGLAVTLSFEDDSTEDVTYGNFNAYNIITVPAHDTPLTVAHNGQHITVTAGGKSANTGNLTVNRASAPAVTFPTTSAITYGETISSSTFSGYTTGRGTFAWSGGAVVPNAGLDEYDVEFTPNDTDTYDYTDIPGWNSDRNKVIRLVSITINKAAGSAVTKPSGAWNLSAKTITVTAVSLNTATGQGIEYAISTSSSAEAASLTWTVNKLTFDITATDTTYFIYARSKESTNYSAGAANVSEGTDTASSPVTSPAGIVMVPIPAGTFTMGSPETEPDRSSNETQHSVTLSGFSISKYQVTQAQWIAVMGTGEDWTTTSYGKGDNYPVYYVSWYDAMVFCNKLSKMEELEPVYSISGSTDPAVWIANNGGTIPTSSNATWDAVVMDKSKNGYRLPTEAEWEYACRGSYANKATETATKPFGIGDGTKMISGMANFDGRKPYDLAQSGAYTDAGVTYVGKTTEVGSYAANNYGLYDMHWNVYEWCWDWYKADITADNTNPTGAVTGSLRVGRGGGWSGYGQYLRSAYRYGEIPYYRDSSVVGFRLVRSSGGTTTTVPVTGVTLNKTTLSLTVGGTETLTATVNPTNATNKTVAWSTSNAAVATVNSTSGTVTAVAAGTATITVTTADGNKTATCSVTVQAAGGSVISPTGIEMVSISGGSFQMGRELGTAGSGDATPLQNVTLTGFSMSKYPVTQAQYQAVMGSNPSSFSSNPASGETQGNRPVETVSWYDAIVFCNKLSIAENLSPAYSINNNTDPAAWGSSPTNNDSTWNSVVIVSGSTGYRLPTEAQWEYAAKGGSTQGNFTYAGSNTVGDVAWYEGNSGSKTHEVGKKAPNALGLYDMNGNVMEWCWDWHGSYQGGAQTDPMGAATGVNRVVRGGSYAFNATYARSISRIGNDPYGRNDNFGFRLVRP